MIDHEMNGTKHSLNLIHSQLLPEYDKVVITHIS